MSSNTSSIQEHRKDIFQGNVPKTEAQRKLIEKSLQKSKDKLPQTQKENQIAEELSKLNIIEQVLGELLKTYDFISVEDKLYVYEENFGYWKLITDSESQRELRRRTDRKWRGRISKSHLQELYEWLILDARHLPASIFREGRHFLNFSDIAYNWSKDKFVKDRKDLYFRYSLNIPYPQSESTGAFKQFLKDTFGDDKETIDQYKKMIGLALSDMREHKYAFILLGNHNSGKSVSMNLLRFLVGPENCSAVSFSQMSSEFHLAVLHSKRLNLSGEVSGTTTNRLDVFKSLCGNDDVLVSNKMKDPFLFRNRCLLIFACNSLPRISDPLETQSFLERLIIFPFKNTKPRDEWDTKLLEHLCDDCPAVISFAIEGLKMFEEDEYVIHESDIMKECKLQYAGMYNSFSMFADQYICSDKNKKVSSADIKKAYHQYCILRDYEELNDNVWAQILKQKFMCSSSTVVEKNGDRCNRIRAYKGVALSPEIERLFTQEPPAPPVISVYQK